MRETRNGLRQKRSQLIDEAKAMFAAAEKAGRPLTSAEQARDEAIEQEIADLDPKIAALEARAEKERALTLELGGGRQARPGAGARYAQLFGAEQLSDNGWQNADEFLSVVHHGLNDPRLAVGGLRATATGAVPSEGGFAVPSQFVAEWLDDSLEDEVVRPRAKVYAMTGSELKVPGFDVSSHASTLYGGFAGGFVAEAAEITPETPKLRLVQLKARKCAVLVETSNELVRDGVGYAEQLSRAMSRAIGWFMDDAFLTGDGASKPLGILSSPALVVVPKEGGQTAATINFVNLTRMFGRLHPALVKRAVWVAHPSCIPQLSTLSLAIGASGTWIPVMSEGDGGFRVLARPVVFSEKVPALGNQGDIGLYALSEYAIGLRADVMLDKSSHVGFTRDTSHFRAILRADGAPLWDKALTLKGSLSVSPFVTLAERA